MKVETSEKWIARYLVHQLYEAGMREAVICPGSRNAPLVIALDAHPDIQLQLIHDERVAGFIALGKIIMTQQPVAVVCTSGSAVVNFFPAVVEAYYQSLPLIVMSADRPADWINHGDGQTIMQENVFGQHVHASLQFSDAMTEKDLAHCSQSMIHILPYLNGNWRGPVHLNVALEEPLYGTHPYSPEFKGNLTFSPSVKETFSEADRRRYETSEKKLILIGQMLPETELKQFLEQISDDPSVAILVENTSNLKHVFFNHCIDRSLAVLGDALDNMKPDLLLTLGGAVVSKKIKQWLRKFPDVEHWRIGFDFPQMDTYRMRRKPYRTAALDALRTFASWHKNNHSTYRNDWKKADWKAQSHMEKFMRNCPESDLKVFQSIFEFLPPDSRLHLANSSVVRYAQLFDPIDQVRYYANRGTSGIDGSSSTAVGAALADPDHWHVLLTGDISFFYDSNAFWLSQKVPNLRVILINNHGGGIFKIIPGPHTTPQYLPYFVAEHHHSARGICEAYNVDYHFVKDTIHLHAEMEGNFWIYNETGSIQLIEVDTGQYGNEKVLADFFECLKG